MLQSRSVESEVKQLLILTIVVFYVLSADILCVSNHIRFSCSDPGYYFLFIGLLFQYMIIVVDLFNNGIRTCILLSSRIIHVDASILV